MAKDKKESQSVTQSDFDGLVRDVLLKNNNMTGAAKEESRELTDKELENVAGSGKWERDSCPNCGHTGILTSKNNDMSKCGKCGATW